jgi:histidine triad (HIT) family protein
MAESECLFCRIAGRKLDTPLAHEDAECVAFRDINPQAPTHLLVIPRRHVESLNDVEMGDAPLLGHLVAVAAKLAEEQGLAKNGYRLVWNTGPHAGQTMFHLHLHLLGGRSFAWPPG